MNTSAGSTASEPSCIESYTYRPILLVFDGRPKGCSEIDSGNPRDAAVFSEADIAEYVRVNSLPGALRAGFEWYATGLREDAVNLAAEARCALSGEVGRVPDAAGGGRDERQ